MLVSRWRECLSQHVSDEGRVGRWGNQILFKRNWAHCCVTNLKMRRQAFSDEISEKCLLDT